MRPPVAPARLAVIRAGTALAPPSKMAEHRSVPLRSALIVQIELPKPLADLRARHDPLASRGVPPHVTVLFPFIPVDDLGPSVGAALAELASAHRPFRARFDRFEHRDAMIWLPPVQPGPFQELTEAVVGRWPMYQPYDGAYDTLIPHLTLVESSTDAIARATACRPRRRTVRCACRGTPVDWPGGVGRLARA